MYFFVCISHCFNLMVFVRLYLLLHHRHKTRSSKPNRTPRVRPRHSRLQVLILPHHVQDPLIHYPSVCWLISCFLSAVHLLNMPIEMHNKRSSKANHKVKPKASRRHRRLSLPPPRHPRHFLLPILVLPHQVQ
jgi:hypothetical protein